jgi:hypothetical protein
MDSLLVRKYEMVVRTIQFGEEYRQGFPAGSNGRKTFAALSAAIAPLGAHAVSQRTNLREQLVKKNVAREAVVECLDEVTRCARVIAKDHPEIGETFKVGRLRSNRSVLAAGRAFIEGATKSKGEFLALGLPETFVTELTERVDALDRSMQEWEATANGNAAARATIEAGLSAALDLLPKLDVIVSNQFKDDPGVLAKWERARRVESSKRSKRAKEATPPDAPTAEPVKEVA